MKCKDFEKQISLYQDNMLSTKELAAFVAHLDECANCREELSIYYLVNEGIMHLDEGGAFDLQQIMSSHRERSANQLRAQRHMQITAYAFAVLLIIAAAFFIFWYVF